MFTNETLPQKHCHWNLRYYYGRGNSLYQCEMISSYVVQQHHWRIRIMQVGRIPTPANSSIQMSLKNPNTKLEKMGSSKDLTTTSPISNFICSYTKKIYGRLINTSKTLSVYRNIQTNLWLCSTRQLTDNCWEAKVPLLGKHKMAQNLPRIQEDLIWMTNKCPTSVSQNYGQLFAEYHDYFWYLSEPY